eukprot:scaffold349786_cov34-Prasinocladus_malaysianus.AAC.2
MFLKRIQSLVADGRKPSVAEFVPQVDLGRSRLLTISTLNGLFLASSWGWVRRPTLSLEWAQGNSPRLLRVGGQIFCTHYPHSSN